MKTLKHWNSEVLGWCLWCVREEGMKTLHPHLQYLPLWITYIWLFLTCILYNKAVNKSKAFSWVLWIALANYHTWDRVMGFSGGSDSKELVCNAGDLGLIPGLGRSLGGGHGNPLQCSCLENPVDKGAWWTTVHKVAKSQTQLKQSSTLVCLCRFFCLWREVGEWQVSPHPRGRNGRHHSNDKESQTGSAGSLCRHPSLPNPRVRIGWEGLPAWGLVGLVCLSIHFTFC